MPGAEQERDGVPVPIRRMRLTDLGGVTSIERACFGTPWPRSEFAFELFKPRSLSLVASTDGRLSGYVVCAPQAGLWHVRNLAVDPTERRHGLGLALMRAVLDRRELTHARVVLDVRESAQPAIALYERLGFKLAGRRPAFYADNGEDALIMWFGGGRPTAGARSS